MAPRWKILGAVALSVVLLDQWTKLLAVEHLTPAIAQALLPSGQTVTDRAHQLSILNAASTSERIAAFFTAQRPACREQPRLCPPVHVIEGFWAWRYAENEGAAWSMFANAPEIVRLPFLIGMAIVAVFFFILMIRKLGPDQKPLLVALSLICGGALGNVIDRTHQGYVVDFILWYRGNFFWPTFNVADVAISTGGGLVLLTWLLDALAQRKARAASPVGESVAAPAPKR